MRRMKRWGICFEPFRARSSSSDGLREERVSRILNWNVISRNFYFCIWNALEQFPEPLWTRSIEATCASSTSNLLRFETSLIPQSIPYLERTVPRNEVKLCDYSKRTRPFRISRAPGQFLTISQVSGSGNEGTWK